MVAISDPNFTKVVMRGCSSRREGWISKEERHRKDREEREKKKEWDENSQQVDAI